MSDYKDKKRPLGYLQLTSQVDPEQVIKIAEQFKGARPGDGFRVAVKEHPPYVQDERFPVVTKDDHGIRPAGAPDECFYCRSRVGERHRNDCVVVSKRVRVRWTVEFDVEVPHGWDKRSIEFHRNDGSWCASNAIAELRTYEEQGGDCLCFGINKFEYVGTVDDTPMIVADGDLRPRKEEKDERTTDDDTETT